MSVRFKLLIFTIVSISTIVIFYSLYSYFSLPESECSIEIAIENPPNPQIQKHTCGHIYSDDTTGIEFYIAKFVESKNIEDSVFLTLNFGNIELDLPVGEINQNNLSISERDKEAYSPYLLDENLVTYSLTEESVSQMTNKYKNHYIQVGLPNPHNSERFITEAKNILNQVNLSSDIDKDIVEENLIFWQNCSDDYSIIIEKINNNISSNDTSIMTVAEKDCLPKLSKITIFI